MKKFFPLTLLIILAVILIAPGNTVQGANRVLLSTKINGYVFKYKNNIEIKITASTKKSIPDYRTVIEITDFDSNQVFKRTFYKPTLKKSQTYTIKSSDLNLENGGYKIKVKATSKQKEINHRSSFFGIASNDSKLNLALIFNIASSPLIYFDNKVNKEANRLISNADNISSYVVSKKHYYSISPLFYSQIKSLSQNNRTKKASSLYRKLTSLRKSPNFFDQSNTIADSSISFENEIDWQISNSKKPYLTNSYPSKDILKRLNSKVVLFNSPNFIYAKSGTKRLIGVNPSASQAISQFNDRSLRRFFAICCEYLSEGKKDMVVVIYGAPSKKYLTSTLKTINKSGVINLSRFSKQKDKYAQININNPKKKQSYFSKLLDYFETIAGENNSLYKSTIKLYLIEKQLLLTAEEHKSYHAKLNKILQTQLSNFTFKPQPVTLTGEKGKIPIEIYSKASYPANLKLVINADNLSIKEKVSNLIIKPKENTFIVPVKAKYGGNNEVKVSLYAGNRLIRNSKIAVNVILPSTVNMYIYASMGFAVAILALAFIFRELRHRKND